MILHPMLRPILAVVAVLLLLALAYTGISGGVQQLAQLSTMPQQAQSTLQVVYGVAALLLLITTRRWRRLRPIAEIGFISGCVFAAGLAAVVWGGGTIVSGVATGIAALVIAIAIVWMLRAGTGSSGVPRNPEN